MLITYIIKTKRANLMKRFVPFEKTISQIFSTSDIYTFIPELRRLAQVMISYYGITKKSDR